MDYARSPSGPPDVPAASYAVVGAGRVGRALVAQLPGASGPFGRGFGGDGYPVVILAVPDSEIGAAAAAIRPGPLVGHCAGAVGLDVLAPHEAFGVHPLMTVSHPFAPFAGASAAVAGTTSRTLATALGIAAALEMRPFEIHDRDRATYHAAASVASNFLVTLEDAAETLITTIGASREILVPLIRATVDNWAREGERALTGPIARGDDSTVARQRAAVLQRAPHLVSLFDCLAEHTQVLARRTSTNR